MQLDSHSSPPAWDYQPEPDVWWGLDGIDALIWANGPPCVDSSSAADEEPTPVVPEVER